MRRHSSSPAVEKPIHGRRRVMWGSLLKSDEYPANNAIGRADGAIANDMNALMSRLSESYYAGDYQQKWQPRIAF